MNDLTIIEYPFNEIFLEELSNELIKTIKLFNSSNNSVYKKELAKNIPIDFPKCRFCGNIIINSNFSISINFDKKSIRINKPSVYCRQINNKKYYLSCCEDCLLKHFNDNPPKSPKYYFMKANKYGAYSFNISFDEYKKICSQTVAVSKKSMIKKWGEIEGIKKWEEYCKKQAITNSFEYKQKKYGWTEKEFKDFNKSRAITIENLINKYGEELGKQKFENYVNKQKLTKSLDYMVQKYGKEKAIEINQSKALTLKNYIKKYGKEKGLEQYELMLNKHHNYFSKISQKFFSELDKYLSKKYTTYYATKNKEYGVNLIDSYICLDYFILELNLCIEFNGTYYHGDPRIFKENDCPNPHNKTLTAKEIWENDNNRYKLLKEIRNINTIVIWENDYYNGINIEKFIKETLNIAL